MKKSQLIKIIKEEIAVMLNESELGLTRQDKGDLNVGGSPPIFHIDLPLQLTKPNKKIVSGTYKELVARGDFTDLEGLYKVALIHGEKKFKPIEYRDVDVSF